MNSNCLIGIKCPHCGHTDDFNIEAIALFHVTDDGTDGGEQVEWNDKSYIQCQGCFACGTVKEFTVEV